MEFSNAPLLATKRDQALFVDREDVTRHLRDSANARLNTVIVGQRGAGKTSMLHRFLARIEDGSDRPTSGAWMPVLVTGEPISAYDFVISLLLALADALESQGITFDRDLLDRPFMWSRSGSLEENSTGSLLAPLRTLGELTARLREHEMSPVFLVDEVAEPAVAVAAFGRMRDELWSLGGTWIVAGEGAQRDALLQPPADVFFERTIEIAPLGPDASRALVHARLASLAPQARAAFDEETLNRVVRLSGGLPLSLVTLARAVLDGRSLDETEADVQRFWSQIATLSDPAQRLAAALRDRGGMGRATDPDLQWQMAWSASRLRQVFQELEHAGVVEHVPSPASRPGRPSKTYRLRSPM